MAARAEVVIIGAGPAGLACALQLKRSGVEPLLLERAKVGGLLLNANLVENYPGFPQGISGVELVRLFEEQLARVGVEPCFEEVLQLDHDGRLFRIETDRRTIRAEIVVIASGTKPKPFQDCPIPEAAEGKVFHEVYPLLGVRGKRVAIVGGGDAAFDYALNLARENHVYILNRTSRTRCLPLLWERAIANPRIRYRENTLITAIEGSSMGKGLVLKLASGGKGWTLEVDYAIFAIGRVPRLDFLSAELKRRLERLKEEGSLYLAGDVRRGIYRQTAIAVGDGLETAMRIYRKLKEELRG
jgi:thioredoxin reductase